MSKLYSNDINFGDYGNIYGKPSLVEKASKLLFDEVMPTMPNHGTTSSGGLESLFGANDAARTTGKQAEQFVLLENDKDKGNKIDSADHYSNLIKQLGDKSFRERSKGSAELEKLGIAAVPHLVDALGNKDLEIARRAEHCIGEILKKRPTVELLEFRDGEHFRKFMEKSLDRQLTPLDQKTAHKQFMKSVNNELFARLKLQPWQSALEYLAGKPNPVTGESIQQLDKIATPDGLAKVTERIKEISQVLNSKQLTSDEREEMSTQLGMLGTLTSPRQLRAQRGLGRIELAIQLDKSNPADQEVQAKLLLEARTIGDLNFKQSVDLAAVRMNLDKNATFVKGFKAQGGNVEALKEIRKIDEDSSSSGLPGIVPPTPKGP